MSSLSSCAPLQLIYSDVWTSPVLSYHGIKYYVIFVNHFTKYFWFYALKCKIDAYDVFICFLAIVEKFFNLKIIKPYSENGDEFLALKDYFAENGISRLTLLPYT